MRAAARVDILGHLGKDAELSYTQSGTERCVFSVAVNVRVQQGTPERTNWYRCTILGKRAAALAPMLTSGTPVHVRGDFDARDWTDNDGNKRTSLDVLAQEIDLLGSKADREQGQQGQTQQRVAQPARTTSYENDEDIPF